MSVTVSAIKDKGGLDLALSRLNEIFMVEDGSPEAEEREVLAALIESYERAHYPIGLEVQAGSFPEYVRKLGLKPSDLVSALGHKTRVSEILHGRRKLTLPMIRALRTIHGIPYEVLIEFASEQSKSVAARRPKHNPLSRNGTQSP